MERATRLKRLLQVGMVAAALSLGVTLAACADDRAASTPVTVGASSTPTLTDERAALPPGWASAYVEAATERFGEPELVEWAGMKGRPADGGLVGETADVATAWSFFGDFVAGDVTRRLGSYVVAARGDFVVRPTDGVGSPVSASTVVIVFRGIESKGRPSIMSAHLTAYVGTVHLAGDDVHVHGPSVGLAPAPEERGAGSHW
jgi:hypothetical protein